MRRLARAPIRDGSHRTFVAALGLLLVVGCDCGKTPPKPETQPAVTKPKGPAVVTGRVLLAPGATLPTFTPAEMEYKVLQHVERGAWPDECTPPRIDDRQPVKRTDDGFLANVMVAASEFSRPSTRPPKTHELTIRDCRLTPTMVVALHGDLLRIQSEIKFPFMPMYTPSPSSKSLIPGQHQDHKLDKLGHQPVRCTFTAPCGRTDVVVLSHTVAAITDETGHFRIDDFPPDETVLVNAWHPLFQPAEQSVRVAPGETRDIEITLTPVPQEAEPAPEPSKASDDGASSKPSKPTTPTKAPARPE
jgi:hypothetical protein